MNVVIDQAGHQDTILELPVNGHFATRHPDIHVLHGAHGDDAPLAHRHGTGLRHGFIHGVDALGRKNEGYG